MRPNWVFILNFFFLNIWKQTVEAWLGNLKKYLFYLGKENPCLPSLGKVSNKLFNSEIHHFWWSNFFYSFIWCRLYEFLLYWFKYIIKLMLCSRRPSQSYRRRANSQANQIQGFLIINLIFVLFLSRLGFYGPVGLQSFFF